MYITICKVANHVVSMIGFTDFLNLTFIILSQISYGKVQRPPRIFLHQTVSKFLLGLLLQAHNKI